MPEKTITVSERKDPNDPEGKSTHAASSTHSAKIADRSIVISLGSTRRKRIRQLKRGDGKLVGRVRSAVEVAAAGLGDDADGKTLIPVVLVYREKTAKKRRRGGRNGTCPLCCI